MIWLAKAHSARVSFSPAGVGVSGSANRMRLTRTFASEFCFAALAITSRNSASTPAGFSSGIKRRSRRKTTRSGTTLVLMPPEMSRSSFAASRSPQWSMLWRQGPGANHRGGQNGVRRLERIDARERLGGMGRAADNLDLKMQRAVMSRHDAIGKASP